MEAKILVGGFGSIVGKEKSEKWKDVLRVQKPQARDVFL